MQLSLISLALTKVYGGAAAFSPSFLFASGEQGAWYDPSDLTTMFQDSAGTTPVTADGQPVGLILDKSKGLVLGSELVTNGDFSSETGWALGSGASISGGVLTLTTTGATDSTASTTFSSVNGKRYELSVTFVSSTTGGTGAQSSATVTVGNGGGSFYLGGLPPGTYKYYPQVSYTGLTSVSLNVYNDTPTTTVFDNISIKELPGNHAMQATTAARPLYKTDGTYHWLQFDGVDDSLSTAAINFTSTDKMSVFAGLVTTDNVGFDGIIQLGSVASGGFWSYFNEAKLEFKVQGSSGVSAVNSAYTPASMSVLTSLMNLGGATGPDCLSTRKNAALFANASIVAGAANFQNGQLLIGGNVVGTWMSGRIYSLIVRGALSTADEITATETWVNQKTGAY